MCRTGVRGIACKIDYSLMLLTYGNVPIPAVVCYAADRNELRSRVIQWLQTEVIPDGWFAKGSNFSDILLKYFKVGIFSAETQKKTLVSVSVHHCSKCSDLFFNVGLHIRLKNCFKD